MLVTDYHSNDFFIGIMHISGHLYRLDIKLGQYQNRPGYQYRQQNACQDPSLTRSAPLILCILLISAHSITLSILLSYLYLSCYRKHDPHFHQQEYQ